MKPITEEKILKLILMKSKLLHSAVNDGNIIDVLNHNRNLSNLLFDLYIMGCYSYDDMKRYKKKYGLSEKRQAKFIKKGEEILCY